MSNELTQRQQEVLDRIGRYIASQQRPPTVRDIMKMINVKSPNGVMCHLASLQKKGYITRSSYEARSIRLVDRDDVIETVWGRV